MAQCHDLFEVALADSAIMVPGIQAMQDHLLGSGQCPFPGGLWLLVVDPRGDSDGLALHLNLEGLHRHEPGARHDRQDALPFTGKTGRKRCHQDTSDVRIPRQLHDMRIGGCGSRPLCRPPQQVQDKP